MLPKYSESEFIRLWLEAKEQGIKTQDLAQNIGMDLRGMLRRRRSIEEKYGPLPTLGVHKNTLKIPIEQTVTISYDHEYTAVIFSDTHWWPNVESPATWIMLEIIQHLAPDVIIANGDILDGATISRHPRIGFDSRPTLKDELDTVKNWMDLIKEASGEADLLRTVGNHDSRFESYLSNHSPQFEGISGTSLKDHLPDWSESWAINLNNQVIVKHRWRGGRHAAANNTLHAGVSTITGHTHRLKADPYTDYRGTRWGCECGTLAEPQGPQFAYSECNPLDWQCGFMVVHMSPEGIIGQPERVFVENGKARWGGKTWAG